MSKPLIQVDDEIREMTDEEYAHYLAVVTPSDEPTAKDPEP